ncbi:hypothetical protein DITRI_Ditri07aG0160500 [Diplodiscus trichospermus]
MKIAEDLRNALLVVAGVIVAATFQAVFSPPGGIRQANDNPTVTINGTCIINGTYINTTVTNTTSSKESPSKNEGKSVMSVGAFLLFSTYNSLILCTVICIIGLLLSDGLFGVNLMFIVAYLLFCYAISIYYISPYSGIATVDLILLSLFMMFLISIMGLYLIGKVKIQKLRYNANKRPIVEVPADEDQRTYDASSTNYKSIA